MITILKSSRYQKERDKFAKGDTKRGNALIKTLQKFSKNPAYPSLNLEKLGGTKIWTIRIDKGNRLFFSWIDDNTIILVDIGKHDKYRKY